MSSMTSRTEQKVETTLPFYPDGAPMDLKGSSTTVLTDQQRAEIMELKARGVTWAQIRGFLGDPGFNGARMRRAHFETYGDHEYPWSRSRG